MRFQIIHLGNPYDFIVKDHETCKTYGTFQGESDSLKECFQDLEKEIDDLKREYRCSKIREEASKDALSCARKEWSEMHEKMVDFKVENESLNMIKRFAERNGICICNIDDAFRRCWDDNAELVAENKQLKEAIIGKIQYGEDLEKFAIKKGIISKDWARFDDYD